MEQELAFKLQDDGIHYQTQVEISVTTADFYFPLGSRPLLVFVDGRVHLGTAQMAKDEELRSLLQERGYRVLELYYDSYSDKKRNQLHVQILDSLERNSPRTLGTGRLASYVSGDGPNPIPRRFSSLITLGSRM
jgi:very-short-patch-repair endonuclease